MKKYTNAEKAFALNEACDLINEARIKMQQAMFLLKDICGIDICDSLRAADVQKWDTYACNVQIYSGISNLESITGKKGKHPTDDFTKEKDFKHKFLKCKDLVFMQVGSVNAKDVYYR